MATWEEVRESFKAAFDTLDFDEDKVNTFNSILDTYTLPDSSDEIKGLKEEIENLRQALELSKANNTTLLKMIGVTKQEDEKTKEDSETKVTIEDILEKEVE